MALPITLSDAGANVAAVSDSRLVSWNLACRDRLLMRIVAILVAALVGSSSCWPLPRPEEERQMNRQNDGAVERAVELLGWVVLLVLLAAVMWWFGGELMNGIATSSASVPATQTLTATHTLRSHCRVLS